MKKYYLFEMKIIPLQVLSIILFLFMVMVTSFFDNVFLIDDFYLVFILLIPYLFLHECLHALSYVLNGADFKNITFGIHLEKGIMCTLCKENISKRNILISLFCPFILIGVFTYFIGIYFNNGVLVWLSILNISGCSGDLMMFFALASVKRFEYSEYDNPIAFGIYTDYDLSNKKLFGLKYVKAVDSLERNDLKKLSVSKISIIFLILFLFFGIFFCII